MGLHTAAFILGALISTVGGNDVEGYSKTEGAWILSLNKRTYSVNTVADCTTKCNTETSFTCKSFIYNEKDQACWTAAVNSKTDSVFRRSTIALYERNAYLLECLNGIGRDYRGTKSRTNSGKICQRWDSSYPHRPNFKPQSHPQAELYSNFCRNPDGDSNGPWCYTTDPNTRWEYCNVPSCFDYLLECVNGIGRDYRGTKSRTNSGKICQRWDSSYPHRPNFMPQSNPLADLDSNFCRNPDGDSNGPWCYTTDANTRWEHCNVPSCSEECMVCNGENYRGKISTTENGFTCQRWDSQKPHNHGYNPSTLPLKYLEENYCRNPDGDPRPWCFTTSSSKRWDFCSIPRCTTEPPTIIPEVDCVTNEGLAYRGTIAVTETGKTCQSWSAQTPQIHNRTPQNYPCKGLDNNYCRNPDNERRPWCYTTDPDTRWEYCNVTWCGNEAAPDDPVIPPDAENCYEGNGFSYRGITSETISGKKCQRWSSMTPHRHEKTPEAFPNADLRRNWCRNPDGDQAPWCYTTDPTVRWEYCNLEKCPTKPSGTTRPQPQEPSTNTQTPAERDCKTGNGETYRGPTSVTVLGVTCQAWSAQTPHEHSSFTPETHANKGLEGNSCRNPDGDVNGPWCYTTDRNKKWDYCQISDCAGLECGTPVVKPKRCFGRIVGGCVSKPHSWPWQISLRTITGIHFCGGTLIHPQWVVTATHCLERSSRPSSYKVLLGVHTELANEVSKQERRLEKIVKEPNGADIALLKLERPVLINDKVQPACLPEKDYIVPSGTECYVTGWGETQGTGGDGTLKEAGFPVIENRVCNRPAYLNGRVKDHEMCAGNIEGGTDSCQGDSGGPLVCYSQNRFVLQGVTSWGLGCANAMKPGVYARVSKFVDWIDRTIKTN
ncbi:plasminogen-like isoform X5 [Astatotilapia calliptera]|uniref:plasminogen-like isoform X5 n=1 Tax=Astatotilapia calliptera TaxID=8154 RepID=UPI000E3FAAD2|nr:plasminogen-like isoform X5 [Astatotilapia calliptera]